MTKHYENDRDWTGIRPTDPHAVPIEHCKVRKGTPVIQVKNARIRQVEVSGYFELANPEKHFHQHDGKLRAEVKCYWYGKRPASGKCWMNLTIIGTPTVRTDYDGEVIVNIGKK